MSYEISLFDGEDTQHRVPFAFDENGKPTLGFVIVGQNSDRYIQCQKRLRAEGIKRRALSDKTYDRKTDEGALEIVEITDANEIAVALAVTVDWFGFTKDGAEAPFDPALAETALSRRPVWRALIMMALEVESNFLPVPPASSDSTSDSSAGSMLS